MTVTRGLGISAVLSLAATTVLGLWVTPPSQNMGTLVRLLYVHPSVAWVAYMAFGLTALASLCYLWPRTRAAFWDRLAVSSAEIGVVFCGLTLATGSIWGRPTWGVWWTWDARLTATALLMALYVGYLAMRRVTTDPGARARRSAVVALIAFADVPIDYLSVYWWHTLHQPPTVLRPGLASPTIAASMGWTLLLSFCSFTVLFVWLLIHRCRLAALQDRLETEGMDLALAERWAEAYPAESLAPQVAPGPWPSPVAAAREVAP